MFVPGIAKSSGQIDQAVAVLPNGYSRAELAEFLEILAKEWFQTLAKFVGVQLHAYTQCSYCSAFSPRQGAFQRALFCFRIGGLETAAL
jgi:hypothetical protein